MSTFSERILSLKNAQNKRQKDIAAAAGVSVRAYQYYETAQKEPTLSVLCALADYFDVPLDYLTGRGIFKNWDTIIEHREQLIESIETAIPSLKALNIKIMSEYALMRVFPSIIRSVEFHDGAIKIYYYF